MKKAHKFMLTLIALLLIVLAAVVVRKSYLMIEQQKKQVQIEQRYEDVMAELEAFEQEIVLIADDAASVENYINDMTISGEPTYTSVSGNIDTTQEITQAEVTEDIIVQVDADTRELVQDESMMPDTGEYSEAVMLSQVIAAEQIEDAEAMIEGEITEPESETTEPSTIEASSVVSSEPQSNELATGSASTVIAAEGITGNADDANELVDQTEAVSPQQNVLTVDTSRFPPDLITPYHGMTGLSLEDNRAIMSSYEQTMVVNAYDIDRIQNSTFDFTGVKIACLGDSITAGSNLESMENYQQYAYPANLGKMLNAASVTNLGIGGSSIGRYWHEAFVDRYQQIPEDTDIIIVMGGTNDGFAADAQELGNNDERKSGTFYGDLSELMDGLKEHYPTARIIFATPLPNVLQDYLMSQRDYLQPQLAYVTAIKQVAADKSVDVIDLYNSNILDTHDSNIISEYMPDGVHCNPQGYTILAQHFAAELISICEAEGRIHPER